MHITVDMKKQESRVNELQAEIDELQAVLGPKKNAEAIASRHIALLHRYNEAKDAAQILIGRLAALRQTTVRKIHEDRDLTDAD